MSYQFIVFEIKDTVASIRLNRPDVLNSFNTPMAKELQACLETCATDKGIRAIYLTGEGRAFCAGQDLAEAVTPNAPKIEEIVRYNYNPIIKKIRHLEKPVVCGVNGVAAGAGANLALACDLTIAAASASFIQSFSKIGLIPDSAGTFFLPRIVGMQQATAMMMLGEKIKAEQALALGMIYKVVDDAQLQEQALTISKQLAVLPTKGLGLTKRALNKSYGNTLEAQLDLEEQLQALAGDSYDFKEGVKAFIEKRPAVFKGE